MKAVLRFYEKYEIPGTDYLVEMSVYEVTDFSKYASGLKSRLVCVNYLSGKKVLFDNHHPKGDHFHLDEKEYQYEFISISDLIDDFKKMVENYLGVIL